VGKELCCYFSYLEMTEDPQFNLTVTNQNDQVAKMYFYLPPPKQTKGKGSLHLPNVLVYFVSTNIWIRLPKCSLLRDCIYNKTLQKQQKQVFIILIICWLIVSFVKERRNGWISIGPDL